MIAKSMRRSRLLKRLFTILAVVITLTSVGLVQAAPAHAVSCYGDYCSGKDPEATGCSAGAVTVAWKDVTGARLELRWSATCKTNWARYIQYPRGWFMGNVPLEMRAVQDTGYTQRKNYGVNGTPEGATWTPMIYSPVRLVRAEMVYQCTSVSDCVIGSATGENPLRTGWA